MKPMKLMKPVWTYPLTWVAVVALALLLALATPRVTGVLGRLPVEVGQKLELKSLPAGQGDERILALVTFRQQQRAQVDSWVKGLKLHENAAVSWLRMPVIDDPKDAEKRAAAEDRLLARYSSPRERARLLPVFTDRDAFIAATGVRGTDQAMVLVITRSGEVLARVLGEFDEDKAQVVRDMLLLDLEP